MKSLTICVASWNAKFSLALMLESARHYNPDYDISMVAVENGSWDGAREYAERHSKKLLLGDNSRNHGWCLTECIRRVDTEFTLTLDNDCFFMKPGALDLMFENLHEKAFCVCPERPSSAAGKGVPYGVAQTIEWSPNIACALFRTEVIQNICQHFHFGYFGDLTSERVYETGGLVWRVGQVLGLDSVEPPELWNNYILHEGALSTLFAMNPTYPDGETEEMRQNGCYVIGAAGYERVKRELAELRGCSVEELDAHEPPSPGMAEVIDLNWTPPLGTHVKLIKGAGVR